MVCWLSLLLLVSFLADPSYSINNGCLDFKSGLPFGNSGIFEFTQLYTLKNLTDSAFDFTKTSTCMVIFDNLLKKKASRCFSYASVDTLHVNDESVFMHLSSNGQIQVNSFAEVSGSVVNYTQSSMKVNAFYATELTWSTCSLEQENIKYRGYNDVIKFECVMENQIGYPFTILARATSGGGCQPLLGFVVESIDSSNVTYIVDYRLFHPLTPQNLQKYIEVFDQFAHDVLDLFT